MEAMRSLSLQRASFGKGLNPATSSLASFPALGQPSLLRLSRELPLSSAGTPSRRRASKALQAKKSDTAEGTKKKSAAKKKAAADEIVVVEEVVMEEEAEEEPSWLSERIEDVQDVTQAVVALVPGPRVGSSSMPWLLAAPLSYLGLTFVIAVVKTIRKINSPKAKRMKQVGKNAGLVETLSEMLQSPDGTARPEFSAADYQAQARKFGFGAPEVLRKYLRYALNEKPFTPDLVASLITFRRASGLADEDVADVLNDIARRTVKAKGPVVMDISGFTEKGIQRKVAVQALFTKLLYLSELEDFCSNSVRDKLQVKSIFGVTDEDADSIRIASLSSAEDLEKLDLALGTVSDDEESKD